MSHADFLFDIFARNRERDAIIWHDRVFDYDWLFHRATEAAYGVARFANPGDVISIESDFSPNSVAYFLALLQRGCILVPLTSTVDAKKSEFLQIAQVVKRLTIDAEDRVDVLDGVANADHALYETLRAAGHPGLVLFSSGSTGASKAAVLDLSRILEKFRAPRAAYRTITFLLYDHIGGVNTLLYTLSNAGCLVTIDGRLPDEVLGAVAKHRVELLPTSPSALNLMLLSGAFDRHDLSSLQTITYGTEPMPESVLKRIHERLPHVRLLQTYGLTEVGILRSKSKTSDSLWVKVGGEGFETRVVDGIFQIRAQSAMLGYLNAPSPFTEDGWFITGDLVETDGDYVRFLGRKSEIINVGGEKVYPMEVESVIQEMPGVAEVTVYGEKNPILGMVVAARVTPAAPVDEAAFTRELKRHCAARLEKFKVPVRVTFSTEKQHSERFKKLRS
ncbi:MAG TPA: fatty acid--CoA ligase family protein [Thermoanaerobaculia bacterium]|nr:fatty acid--CoA ligase family protein [Thermoanaerobaculia bacterium]